MFFIAKIIAKIQFHLSLQNTNSLISSRKIIANIIARITAIYCAKVGDVTGTLDGDTDTAAVFLKDGIWQSNSLECLANLPDAASPSLDKTGKEKYVCNQRVALAGRMFLQQHLYREVLGEGTFVPNGDTVIIDFHLDKSSGVKPVNEGVVYNFTQGCLRDFQWFRAFHSFIPDIGNQVLGPKDFHNPVGHPYDVSLDDVLKQEVGLVADEAADAKVYAAHKVLWMGAEKDDGSNSEIAGFRDEVKILEDCKGVIFQGICRKAFLLDSFL